MSDCAYKRGDWVRFYNGGLLVIGQVEYTRYEVGGRWEIATDKGTTRDDQIREHRRATEAPHD